MKTCKRRDRENLRRAFEARINLAVAELSDVECRRALFLLVQSMATDCGNAPAGMRAEGEDYQRRSCVDQVEDLERILSGFNLQIE